MCELSKDDFYSISQLQIAYADFQSTTTTATIYANGNNQVAVTVLVKLVNQEGNPARVEEDVVKKAVYLCNFNGGKSSLKWMLTEIHSPAMKRSQQQSFGTHAPVMITVTQLHLQ